MTELVLLSSPPSPFGRKVKMAAAVAGLSDRIRVEKTDTTDAEGPLRKLNPLGKIPALVTPDLGTLYDSRVIVEYFDLLAGGGVLIPVPLEQRMEALRLQALADGIMDAGVLRRYEAVQRKPQERSAAWDSLQAGKIERAVAILEAAPPTLASLQIGQIAVAAALGYLDFRFEGHWRAGAPKMVAWLDGFAAQLPSFAATAPTG